MINQNMNDIYDVNNKFTFNRNSYATLSDASLVLPNNARYEPVAGLGNGIMFEEGTTNLFANTTITSSNNLVFNKDENAWTMTRASTDIQFVISSPFQQQLSKTYTLSFEIWADANSNFTIDDNDNIHLNGVYDSNIPQNDTWRKTVAYKNKITTKNQWVKFEKTITTRSVGENFATNYANTIFTPVLAGHTAINNDAITIPIATTVKVRNLQYEEKAYASTYVGNVRNQESAIVQTAGLFGATEGTVEFTFVPNFNQDDAQRTASWRFLMNDTNNAIRAWIWSGSTTGTFVLEYFNADDTRNNADFSNGSFTGILKGVPVKLSMCWSGNVINMFSNGVKMTKTGTTLKTIGSTIIIGNANGGNYNANGIITDIRFSNIARTDTELIANGTSTVPLPIDANTTLKLDLNRPDSYRIARQTNL